MNNQFFRNILFRKIMYGVCIVYLFIFSSCQSKQELIESPLCGKYVAQLEQKGISIEKLPEETMAKIRNYSAENKNQVWQAGLIESRPSFWSDGTKSSFSMSCWTDGVHINLINSLQKNHVIEGMQFIENTLFLPNGQDTALDEKKLYFIEMAKDIITNKEFKKEFSHGMVSLTTVQLDENAENFSLVFVLQHRLAK